MKHRGQFIVQGECSNGRTGYFRRGRDGPETDCSRSQATVYKLRANAEAVVREFGGEVIELLPEPTPAERQAAILRESLADLAHAQWSEWMVYLFSRTGRNPDGTSTIPSTLVDRWQRQMMTPYADLPEHEKPSDRAEADKMIAVMRNHFNIRDI